MFIAISVFKANTTVVQGYVLGVSARTDSIEITIEYNTEIVENCIVLKLRNLVKTIV